MYKDKYHPKVKRDLKKIDNQVQNEIVYVLSIAKRENFYELLKNRI